MGSGQGVSLALRLVRSSGTVHATRRESEALIWLPVGAHDSRTVGEPR
jgi:hypothetical protein